MPPSVAVLVDVLHATQPNPIRRILRMCMIRIPYSEHFACHRSRTVKCIRIYSILLQYTVYTYYKCSGYMDRQFIVTLCDVQ